MAGRKPIALIVCDGWGYNPRRDYNAIAMARTPHFDELNARYASTLLHTSGLAVGLPEGQMGNSEVGHMNMGAGRIVYQELTRIDKAIRDGDFFANPVLVAAVEHAKKTGGALHLFGLLSDGGVHSSNAHVEALLKLAADRGLECVWLHAFLDGRDTPPKSALTYLARFERAAQQAGVGRIATVSGRYYAMDRDQNWDRTVLAYRAMVDGVGPTAPSAEAAVEAAYAEGVTDEFLKPTVIDAAGLVRDGDAALCFNFRPDRARQIVRALFQPDFAGFERTRPEVAVFCMTQYDVTYGLPVAYLPQQLVDNLADVLETRRVRQLHSAETEKYAHVTFFFNCGREAPHELESRILIPSPKVPTYDLKPEMSAPEVAEAVRRSVEAGETDVVIMNFANADMVGHTGNLEATIAAIEAVDAAVGKVVGAVHARGGVAIVTADHGNAEQMLDYATGSPHTAHTTNPVPCLVTGGDFRLREGGVLADIAPTILDLLDIGQPAAMTARSLLA